MEGAECSQGEVDYRGSFRSCDEPARCDSNGTWFIPRGPIAGGECGPGPMVYFEKGRSGPEGRALDGLSRMLAKSAGRFYVLAQYGHDEGSELDLERANAIKLALVRAGFCESKLVVLRGGLAPPEHERAEPRPMGQLIMISDYANDRLIRAGILKSAD